MTEAAFLNGFGLFLMGLLRYSGFFINTPVFSESIIPMRSKAGLAMACALITLPHLIATHDLPTLSIAGYGLAAIRELVLGYSIGYMVLVVMASMRLGGQIIGMQIGFSFVQVADPNSNQSLGIVGEFFQMIATLVFLVIGGHLLLLQTFFQSFDMVPLNGLMLTSGIVEETMLYTRVIFVSGLQIAMPIIGVILIGDVALGIIARTVPKLNIFQVGFSLKILSGLMILTWLMPLLGDFINHLLRLSLGQINTILGQMS